MEQVREEEDASRLQFGPGESVIKVYTNKKEFDAAGMLSTSEVAYLFQTRQAKGDASTFTPVFNATLTYTQTFSKLKTKAAIQESRKLLLEHPSLTAFERAQLINYSVAEAKSLIPSLGELGEDEDNRLTDDNLQDLLDELKKLRKYT